jgi:LysR family transcriptional activator of nhaA
MFAGLALLSCMAWLNYHHLLYFWTVAREGSVTRAAAVLHLTQPAVSSQLRTLERSFGQPLFERRGRALALTEAGGVVFQYADEIFTVGRELQQVMAGGPPTRPARLSVGVVDSTPKLLTVRLLEPALRPELGARLVIQEGTVDRLITELAAHRIDVVLADAPAPADAGVKAFSHLLGESGVTVFAAAELAKRYRRRFPRSLHQAAFIMPAGGTTLRRSLDQWFDELGVAPTVLAEIHDSAVMKAFGQSGVGLFAAPTVLAAEIRRQYGVRPIGVAGALRERFYAITMQRRITHPAVTAITRTARAELFARPQSL